MPTNPTQGRQSTFCDVLSAVPVFDGYNVPIIQFIDKCREVQNAISPQKKTNVVTLLQIARPNTKDAPSSTVY